MLEFEVLLATFYKLILLGNMLVHTKYKLGTNYSGAECRYIEASNYH